MANEHGREKVRDGVAAKVPQRGSSTLRRIAGLPTFSSLVYPDFRWLWVGSISSQIGNWMQQVALGWLVLDMTGSPFLLGAIGFVRSVPTILFSLVGGVAADRINRRDLIMLSQSITAALSLLLAVLISTGWIQVWEVFAITFLMGVGMALNMPARQALISDTVDRSNIANAVSLNMAASGLTRVIGPSLAGFLIASTGVAGSYYIQAGAFLLGLITSYPIKAQTVKASVRKDSPWRNFVDGLRYMRANPVVAAIILIEAAPGFFVLPYLILMPIFAKDILNVGAEGLGIMMAIPGAGALVGAIVLASLGNYRYKGLLALMTSFILGVSIVGYALSTSWPFTVTMLIIIGAFGMNFTTITVALILSIVPSELQGRVTSLHSLAFGGMMPLGSAVQGALAGVIGAPLTVAAGGAIAAVITVGVGVFVPRFRQLH